MPYDIEIQTLHSPEPEHDPPSAEPAEPEPPAMSDEERLILEQEGPVMTTAMRSSCAERSMANDRPCKV